jgi:uncharacterized protein YjbJ (UPF0337 family)
VSQWCNKDARAVHLTRLVRGIPIGVIPRTSWAVARGSGPPSTPRMVAVVGFADKFRIKAQELRGRIKRNTGEVTGDKGVQARGRVDEVKSYLKRIVEKVKDAFRGRGPSRRRRQH